MYTVLVVDDFLLDRRRMAQAITSFTDLPVQLAGECEDGVEALEMIRDLKPDILLCDVEMPHITGLELADKLRQNQSDIRIIFCSLYDKLHYLRAAISVRSDGYIMKPFTRQELHDCIAKVLMELINLDTQRQELTILHTAMESSRSLMEGNFFSDLIYGYVKEEEELASRCYLLHLRADTHYSLAVVEIDDYFLELYSNIGANKEEDSLVCYRVFRMLENASQRSDGERIFHVVRLSEKCYVLIYLLEPERSDAETKRLMDDILHRLIHEANAATISLTATFSEKTCGLLKMKEQCDICRYRLDYKWLLGKGRVIYAGEVPGHAPQSTINVVEVQRQVRLLLNDTNSDISERNTMMTRKLLEPLNPLQRQLLCQYIFTCIQIILQENGAELANVMPDISITYPHMFSLNTSEQYNAFIITMLEQAHAF